MVVPCACDDIQGWRSGFRQCPPQLTHQAANETQRKMSSRGDLRCLCWGPDPLGREGQQRERRHMWCPCPLANSCRFLGTRQSAPRHRRREHLCMRSGRLPRKRRIHTATSRYVHNPKYCDTNCTRGQPQREERLPARADAVRGRRSGQVGRRGTPEVKQRQT